MSIVGFIDRALVRGAERVANRADRIGVTCRNFSKYESARENVYKSARKKVHEGLEFCAFSLVIGVIPFGVGYTVGMLRERSSLKDRQITHNPPQPEPIPEVIFSLWDLFMSEKKH